MCCTVWTSLLEYHAGEKAWTRTSLVWLWSPKLTGKQRASNTPSILKQSQKTSLTSCNLEAGQVVSSVFVFTTYLLNPLALTYEPFTCIYLHSSSWRILPPKPDINSTFETVDHTWRAWFVLWTLMLLLFPKSTWDMVGMWYSRADLK